MWTVRFAVHVVYGGWGLESKFFHEAECVKNSVYTKGFFWQLLEHEEKNEWTL